MAETTRTTQLEREALATRTLVELIDSMVDEFDVIDLLTLLSERAVRLLDVSAAGILLADERGRLRVLAASTEDAELLELFQVQNEQGPCLDSFAAGELVVAEDLAKELRWPLFTAEARGLGYRSVSAVPLRLRATVLGCLNLFMERPGGLSGPDVTLARALADVSSIAMVQDRALRDSVTREAHLQHALESRVAIEQAKGMIAERLGIELTEAFDRMRTHARNHNLRLTDLAEGVLQRLVPVADLDVPGPKRRS